MKQIPAKKVAEARQLRLKGRKSIGEICEATGISKATLSVLLRDIPLTAEELLARRKSNAAVAREAKAIKKEVERKEAGAPYHLHAVALSHDLTTNEKSVIGEAAVQMRLAARGIQVHRHPDPTSPADLFILKNKTCVLIQVKTIVAETNMFNCQRKHKGSSFRPYRENEFDFLVAYHLKYDKCYVIPCSRLVNNTSFSIKKEHLENWEPVIKLLNR